MNKNYFPKNIDKLVWESFHTTKYEPNNNEHQEFVLTKSNNFLLWIMSVIGYSKDTNIPFIQLLNLMQDGIVKKLGWSGENTYLDIILSHITTDSFIQHSDI